MVVRLTVQRSGASGGETRVVRGAVEREAVAVQVVVEVGEVSASRDCHNATVAQLISHRGVQ